MIKEYILQFIPKNFEYLIIDKITTFKNKELHSDLIIDLIHQLLLKEMFLQHDEFNLSSEVLRKLYGTYYNYYLDYIIDKGLLSKVSNYIVGNKCNTFKLHNNDIIIRYKNYNCLVLKRWVKNNNYSDIKNQLYKDLFNINIDIDASLLLLENYKDDKDVYNKNLYTIETIHDKSFYCIEDDYGRLHTNITILKKEIRDNFLTIDNNGINNIDIVNSQPFFFTQYMLINKLYSDSFEFRYFKDMVYTGKIYEHLSTDRKISKQIVFKVLFGQNKLDKWNIEFIKLFPSIHLDIQRIKRQANNYKVLAHILQRNESDFVYNTLCKEIKEYKQTPLFTVHDSVYFKSQYKEDIQHIFDRNMAKLI